jgi:hypothetical protein
MEFVNFLAKFLRENSIYVAIAIVATTLAIYGIYLKKLLKNITKKMNFLLRFIIYVFVYAFGLGFLSAKTVKFIESSLSGLNNTYLVLAVSFVFLLLCLSAKNEKQI